MKQKISVRLSEEVVERLEAAAQRPGASKTAIVEAALDGFLNPGTDLEHRVLLNGRKTVVFAE